MVGEESERKTNREETMQKPRLDWKWIEEVKNWEGTNQSWRNPIQASGEAGCHRIWGGINAPHE